VRLLAHTHTSGVHFVLEVLNFWVLLPELLLNYK